MHLVTCTATENCLRSYGNPTILASLRRHRIPAFLIVLEIALACAVLCNAVFMISQRVADILVSNAIDEPGISVITLNGADPARAAGDIPRNLAALRGILGVKAVATTSSMPLDTNAALNSFTATPEGDSQVNSAEYFIGSDAEKRWVCNLLQGAISTLTSIWTVISAASAPRAMSC